MTTIDVQGYRQVTVYVIANDTAGNLVYPMTTSTLIPMFELVAGNQDFLNVGQTEHMVFSTSDGNPSATYPVDSTSIRVVIENTASIDCIYTIGWYLTE